MTMISTRREFTQLIDDLEAERNRSFKTGIDTYTVAKKEKLESVIDKVREAYGIYVDI
jgi:hypothetical protein